jgi:hypothetical protein
VNDDQPGLLLVTTSHSLLRVDPDSGSYSPVHRGAGLYYGMANDGRNWYVAARRRMVSSQTPSEEERGEILIFDAELRLIGEIEAPFPLRDMHEIMWHAGMLWITCSFDNMVATFHPATAEWERWFPLGETPTPPFDVNHLNSLAMIDGTLHVMAHNFGVSELLRFDVANRALLSRIPLGMHSHNVREGDNGALLTCSSSEGALIDSTGWRLEVGGFTRGLALGATTSYVGISELLERQERDLSDGRIAVYDAGWRLLRTLTLRGEGLVLDIHFAAVGKCNSRSG